MPENPHKPLTVVVLIRTDPFDSPKGVEAIRMALGLGSGVNLVDIILMGNAPFLLSEEREKLVDYETLEKYISNFEDTDKPFYVDESFLLKHPDFKTPYKFESVSRGDIAKILEAGKKFLIF